MSGLTHLDSDGRARMVDVGDKRATARVATASGRLETTAEVVALVRSDGLTKADVLATARIAGIGGAKRTSELIPLCHPLPLDSVSVDFGFEDHADDGDGSGRGPAITITATARTTGRTGVEMEALTAVAVAGLTLHDMVKAVDPAATLTAVRLEEKTGGRRGRWTRTGGRERDAAGVPDDTDAGAVIEAGVVPGTAAVLVVSTGSAEGTRADTTGPVIADWLAGHGYRAEVSVVADADATDGLAAALRGRPAVLVTTGGTGLGRGDQTPEATRAVLDRELPGVAEAIRARGLASTPTAALSRGLAGVSGGTVVVNLAGSSGAVRDGLAVLDGLLDHLVNQLAGETDHG